jgi:CheY-like chemotaxis protein
LEGSAFTIQIPFDEAAEGFTGQRGELGNVPRVHSEETGGQHHDLRQYSARVLVAEDNAVNQEVARENLILLGCTVEIAVDGKQAVDKWHSLSPDLILMDCQMPEVDGFVATEIIRQHEAAQGTGAHVPIIALTAHVLEKDRNKCLAAGMDDHLPKPFNIGQLNEILDRWLSSETACQASKLETEESPPVSKTPPPAQGAQESMTDAIDHDALNRLRHLYKDNSAGFRKTVQLFLDTGTESLQKIGVSMSKNDLEAVWQIAHTLKSSSANLGAMAFSELCRQLEAQAQDKTPEDAAKTLAAAEAEFARVEKALRIIIAGPDNQIAS